MIFYISTISKSKITGLQTDLDNLTNSIASSASGSNTALATI